MADRHQIVDISDVPDRAFVDSRFNVSNFNVSNAVLQHPLLTAIKFFDPVFVCFVLWKTLSPEFPNPLCGQASGCVSSARHERAAERRWIAVAVFLPVSVRETDAASV